MTTAVFAAPAQRVAAASVSTYVAPVRPLRRAAVPQANAPCPCGSGRKAKKCCGLSAAVEQAPSAPDAPAVPGTDAGVPACPEAVRSEEASSPDTVASTVTQCVAATEAASSASEAEAADTETDPNPNPNREAPPGDLHQPSLLRAEGTGCAAWMRLTGLYPWKPLSMAERRAGLERLTRYTRHWMRRRMAAGAFRSFSLPLPEGMPASGSDGAEAEGMEAPAGGEFGMEAEEPMPTVARTHAESSFELAENLEISEAKLNQLLREQTGLSARDWWDALRAPGTLKVIRAEIETALDGMVLDRTAQIRRRGVQLMDLHRALRQHRRALGSGAADRAWNWGYKSASRLNLALWRATGLSMPELEARILSEIYETWSFDHQTCRLCAKNHGGADRSEGTRDQNVWGACGEPIPVEAEPGGSGRWSDAFGPGVRIA